MSEWVNEWKNNKRLDTFWILNETMRKYKMKEKIMNVNYGWVYKLTYILQYTCKGTFLWKNRAKQVIWGTIISLPLISVPRKNRSKLAGLANYALIFVLWNHSSPPPRPPLVSAHHYNLPPLNCRHFPASSSSPPDSDRGRQPNRWLSHNAPTLELIISPWRSVFI